MATQNTPSIFIIKMQQMYNSYVYICFNTQMIFWLWRVLDRKSADARNILAVRKS